MAIHSIGPYFVRLTYTAGGHGHTMAFSVAAIPPHDTEVVWTVTKKSGDVSPLATCLNTLAVALAGFVHTDSGFNTYALYHMATPTGEPVWCDGGDLVGGGGSGTPSDVLAGQFEITFRSTTGGKYRFQVMEGILHTPAVMSTTYMEANAPTSGLIALLTGEDGVVLARDGGYLAAALRGLTKINDKLRHRYIV